MTDDPRQPEVDPPADPQTAPDGEPLASVHTASFPEILDRLAASVAVTTYQAGKLVLLRNDGGVLNTHFRNLSRPMGLAHRGGRLAVGCRLDLWEFHNVPAVCPKLDESDDYPSQTAQHDACFLPRRSHCTGDIQVHEMAWVTDEASGDQADDLVFVNTAFSCLARRSDENSFEPVWRPPFIRQLSPGDHCHLNGLAVRDGRARYATALGEANEPQGWRQTKRNGGVVIDIPTGEIITRGLSMPHSPRWHDGRLWLLESGEGTLGVVDRATGRYEPVAHFPGFTRGLAFAGPLAFVGLSQVRESAVFSGIPLVERLKEAEERVCGVWVVDTNNGQTVGFCRFKSGVQEVFAVEVLPAMRFPDLVNHDPELISRAYVLGDDALADVPKELRK
ncbi:MAG: TIGR03032 family protein [Planctomycetota bacterium]